MQLYMKTNKQLVKELQLRVEKLRAVNSELLKSVKQLSNIATNNDYSDLLKRLDQAEDYKDEVESLYQIVTSSLKDDIILDMLKRWVIETRSNFKQQKELEL